MSRDKLISRTVQRLTKTAEMVSRTDHDQIGSAEEEVDEISLLFRQLVDHLNYVRALHPDSSSQIGIASCLAGIGQYKNSVEALIQGVQESTITEAEENILFNEHLLILKAKRQLIVESISALDRYSQSDRSTGPN